MAQTSIVVLRPVVLILAVVLFSTATQALKCEIDFLDVTYEGECCTDHYEEKIYRDGQYYCSEPKGCIDENECEERLCPVGVGESFCYAGQGCVPTGTCTCPGTLCGDGRTCSMSGHCPEGSENSPCEGGLMCPPDDASKVDEVVCREVNAACGADPCDAGEEWCFLYIGCTNQTNPCNTTLDIHEREFCTIPGEQWCSEDIGCVGRPEQCPRLYTEDICVATEAEMAMVLSDPNGNHTLTYLSLGYEAEVGQVETCPDGRGCSVPGGANCTSCEADEFECPEETTNAGLCALDPDVCGNCTASGNEFCGQSLGCVDRNDYATLCEDPFRECPNQAEFWCDSFKGCVPPDMCVCPEGFWPCPESEGLYGCWSVNAPLECSRGPVCDDPSDICTWNSQNPSDWTCDAACTNNCEWQGGTEEDGTWREPHVYCRLTVGCAKMWTQMFEDQLDEMGNIVCPEAVDLPCDIDSHFCSASVGCGGTDGVHRDAVDGSCYDCPAGQFADPYGRCVCFPHQFGADCSYTRGITAVEPPDIHEDWANNCPYKSTTWPEARWGHAAFGIDDTFVVFGGTTRNLDSGDLPNGWGNLETPSYWLGQLVGTVINDTWSVGLTEDNYQQHPNFYDPVNPYHAESGYTQVWTKFSSQGPSARAFMAYATHNGYGWVFGGSDGSNFFDDLWRLKTDTGDWVQITAGVSPAGRAGGALAGREGSSELYLYGGWGNTASDYLPNAEMIWYLSWTEISDTSTYTWTSLGGLVVAETGERAFAQAVWLNPDLLVIGGGIKPSGFDWANYEESTIHYVPSTNSLTLENTGPLIRGFGGWAAKVPPPPEDPGRYAFMYVNSGISNDYGVGTGVYGTDIFGESYWKMAPVDEYINYNWWSVTTTGWTGGTSVFQAGVFMTDRREIVEFGGLSHEETYSYYCPPTLGSAYGINPRLRRTKVCDLGEYWTDGACLPCVPGTSTENFWMMSDSCSPCQAGTSLSYGAKTCDPCPPGSGTVNTGMTSVCEVCSPGTYSPDGVYCNSCEPGFRQPESGATECIPCEAGFFRSGDDPLNNDCEACPPGQFSEEGAEACTPCPANTYSMAWGQGDACIECGVGAITLMQEGASDPNECRCNVGWFGTANGNGCQECPDGAECTEFDQVDPVPSPGFWADPGDPTVIFECSTPSACPGGGSGTCAAGYAGQLCGACDNGFYKLGGNCEPCPENSGTTITALLIGVVLMGGVFVKFAGVPRNLNIMASLSISLNFIQVMALFPTFGMDWPPFLISMFEFMSIFNFNMDVASPECSYPMSYQDKLKLKLALPLVVGLVLGFFYVVFAIIERCRGKKGKKSDPQRYLAESKGGVSSAKFAAGGGAMTASQVKLDKHGQPIKARPPVTVRIVAAWITFCTVLYTMLVSSAWEIFRCTKQQDGTSTMNASPDIRCYQDEWWGIYPFALASILIYAVGIPAWFSWTFYKASKRGLLYDDVWRAKYGSLVLKYKGRWFWYEVIVMLRKLGIVLSTLTTEPLFQALIGIMVIFSFILMEAFATPYETGANNRLEFATTLATFMTMFSGLLFYSGKLPDQKSETFIVVLVVGASVLSAFMAITTVGSDLRSKIRKKAKVTPFNKSLDKVGKERAANAEFGFDVAHLAIVFPDHWREYANWLKTRDAVTRATFLRVIGVIVQENEKEDDPGALIDLFPASYAFVKRRLEDLPDKDQQSFRQSAYKLMRDINKNKGGVAGQPLLPTHGGAAPPGMVLMPGPMNGFPGGATMGGQFHGQQVGPASMPGSPTVSGQQQMQQPQVWSPSAAGARQARRSSIRQDPQF